MSGSLSLTIGSFLVLKFGNEFKYDQYEWSNTLTRAELNAEPLVTFVPLMRHRLSTISTL